LDNTFYPIHLQASSPYEFPLKVRDSNFDKSTSLNSFFSSSVALSNLFCFGAITTLRDLSWESFS
jgi:hypothetical protein